MWSFSRTFPLFLVLLVGTWAQEVVQESPLSEHHEQLQQGHLPEPHVQAPLEELERKEHVQEPPAVREPLSEQQQVQDQVPSDPVVNEPQVELKVEEILQEPQQQAHQPDSGVQEHLLGVLPGQVQEHEHHPEIEKKETLPEQPHQQAHEQVPEQQEPEVTEPLPEQQQAQPEPEVQETLPEQQQGQPETVREHVTQQGQPEQTPKQTQKQVQPSEVKLHFDLSEEVREKLEEELELQEISQEQVQQQEQPEPVVPAVKDDNTQATHEAPYGPDEYGVDCSFPLHYNNFKYRSACNNHLGNRYNLYKEFMWGCRALKGVLCDHTENDRIDMNLRQPQSLVNYTAQGYQKIRAPAELFNLLQQHWERNKNRDPKEESFVEEWPGGNTYVNWWKQNTTYYGINDADAGGSDALHEQIWELARPILEDWTGMELQPASLYGIR